MKRKPNTDHVVADSIRQGFYCEHCGALEPFTFPYSMKEFARLSDAFIRAHKDCPKPTEETT